ncbi:hypothetical protein BRAS3843_470035 [Bradyrhizobium sp. STM 3843]|uniref:hypothetical protein n=1 Tax=Bradyrhizobium sp. STM 3843 TaxID=551947 RepID=UPI0002403D4D|nr:hypothetical protein [Bradyrhizobium sp. STM 3843]CCE10339.1 hypothetical protein BRAS3843_470035 [Bradyrhizobium sp. STM 3843]
MSCFLGPLDISGRLPPKQQTRIGAFLISAHGALMRQLTLALGMPSERSWLAELNAQLFRETEIVSLMLQATRWVPDLELLALCPSWEAAWLITPVPNIPDQTQGWIIDLAALGHAIHGAVRPAAVLPDGTPRDDAFAEALRRTEFESGRLIQAQILFLKSPEFVSMRDAVGAAVDRRHAQVRRLWREVLASIGVASEASA